MKRWVWILGFTAALFVIFVRAECSSEETEQSLPIVMYHHISKDSNKWNDYVVSLQEFESDMEYLTTHGWHSISVSQLLAWEAGEFEMPEKPFMLTFDDGFESTMIYAEPILAERGLQGTVAVIGSVCEEFSNCGEHDPELSNLSWEDVREMADRGVIDIQCHTWNMHALHPRKGCSQRNGESTKQYRAALSADLSHFLQESYRNKVDIVPSIAYPYGACSEATEQAVRDMGFAAAFTCEEKINRLQRGEEELFHLGRFNRPHGISSEKFFKKWEKTN